MSDLADRLYEPDPPHYPKPKPQPVVIAGLGGDASGPQESIEYP